jgi:hypothetical protein
LFCGSTDIEIDDEGICCNGCDFWLGFDGYAAYDVLRAEGVKRWNTRPVEDALRAEVERIEPLREALKRISTTSHTMRGTPLGTNRQERRIWQDMGKIADKALGFDMLTGIDPTI